MIASSPETSYYRAATEAEARLLLGDEPAARAALEQAKALNDGDFGALATTRRQLRLACGLAGLDLGVLEPLAGPSVVHFCGHRIAAHKDAGRRLPDSAEANVAATIGEVVARHNIGFAYGALACGADIMWAEALVANGSELHVVLPFARDEFVRLSVLPAGESWVERFDRCLNAAESVRYATDDAFLGDDVLFRYSSELAMGLTLLRARYLDAEARQLAVWDGEPAVDEAGTAIDIAAWRRTGRPLEVVSPTGRLAPSPSSAEPAMAGSTRSGGRVVRAMLFGDVRGFSKLADQQLPVFAQRVLGAMASVVERYGDRVGHSNTWGDALFVVLSDATSAAACALDLQDEMNAIDLEKVGLPLHLALRLSGHLGPVFPVHDPVLDRQAFMGSHVSRAARIEPVTPPGSVYVTEPFAAALELEGSRVFACDYVGHMPAAKDYGRLRMYGLRRA
jgi:class 3 adenylate cyclase